MIAPGFEYSCGDALGVATLLFNSTDECAHIYTIGRGYLLPEEGKSKFDLKC